MQIDNAGLTPSQQASTTGQLRRDWTAAVKPFRERTVYVTKLQEAIPMLWRDRNAATQVAINSFNRLLEEGNAVREGEYKRSEELAPYLTRVEAFKEKFFNGGGSLTNEQLQSLAEEGIRIAKLVGEVHESGLRDLRQGIEEQLDAYAIPTTRVFGNSTIGVRSITVVGNNGKTYGPFKTQEEADAFMQEEAAESVSAKAAAAKAGAAKAPTSTPPRPPVAIPSFDLRQWPPRQSQVPR